jgi:hypothetical protein
MECVQGDQDNAWNWPQRLELKSRVIGQNGREQQTSHKKSPGANLSSIFFYESEK